MYLSDPKCCSGSSHSHLSEQSTLFFQVSYKVSKTFLPFICGDVNISMSKVTNSIVGMQFFFGFMEDVLGR